jgi:hypothetical protein
LLEPVGGVDVILEQDDLPVPIATPGPDWLAIVDIEQLPELVALVDPEIPLNEDEELQLLPFET